MQNASIFRRILQDAGLPEHVIDAAIANFIWESAGQTDINTAAVGDNGASHGAGQWQGSRWRALQEFAQRRGTPWTDPATQAMFFLEEGRTTESPAFQALMNTSTADEALDVITNQYERAGTPHMEQRRQLLGRITGQGQSGLPPIRQAFQAFEMGRADRLRQRAGRSEARARGEQPLREEFAQFRAARARGETPIRDRLLSRLGQMFPQLGQRLQNLGGRLSEAGQPQPTAPPAPSTRESKLPPLPPKPRDLGPGSPKPTDAVAEARRSNFRDFFQFPQPQAATPSGIGGFAPVPGPMGMQVGDLLAQSFGARAQDALNIGQGFLDFDPAGLPPAGTQIRPPVPGGAGAVLGDIFNQIFDRPQRAAAPPARPVGETPPPPPTAEGVRRPQLNPSLLPSSLLAPRPMAPVADLDPFPTASGPPTPPTIGGRALPTGFTEREGPEKPQFGMLQPLREPSVTELLRQLSDATAALVAATKAPKRVIRDEQGRLSEIKSE